MTPETVTLTFKALTRRLETVEEILQHQLTGTAEILTRLSALEKYHDPEKWGGYLTPGEQMLNEKIGFANQHRQVLAERVDDHARLFEVLTQQINELSARLRTLQTEQHIDVAARATLEDEVQEQIAAEIAVTEETPTYKDVTIFGSPSRFNVKYGVRWTNTKLKWWVVWQPESQTYLFSLKPGIEIESTYPLSVIECDLWAAHFQSPRGHHNTIYDCDNGRKLRIRFAYQEWEGDL